MVAAVAETAEAESAADAGTAAEAASAAAAAESAAAAAAGTAASVAALHAGAENAVTEAATEDAARSARTDPELFGGQGMLQAVWPDAFVEPEVEPSAHRLQGMGKGTAGLAAGPSFSLMLRGCSLPPRQRLDAMDL
mmetsp:Transcript_23551/g.42495  ORF Transcript_23551/g.42495 Transcript_23551/m.42495 type:complete len:137 (+) Transcript_23551:1410-1820(+)